MHAKLIEGTFGSCGFPREEALISAFTAPCRTTHTHCLSLTHTHKLSLSHTHTLSLSHTHTHARARARTRTHRLTLSYTYYSLHFVAADAC